MSIYRLHPDGARFENAEPTRKGEAHKSQNEVGALRFCGPFVHAGSCGVWAYPPVDMDITYLGDGQWDIEQLSEYTPLDGIVIKNNLRTEDKFRSIYRGGRISVGKVEPDLIQIWTGCIFRTPPGWGLHVRQPINFPEAYNRPYHIQEGIIESDWLWYDIWFNIRFHRANEKAELRRDMWPPLAQLVPVRKEAYAKCEIQDQILDRKTEDGGEVWDFWQEYNYQKWYAKNEKDSRTYNRTRKLLRGEERRNKSPGDGSTKE